MCVLFKIIIKEHIKDRGLTFKLMKIRPSIENTCEYKIKQSTERQMIWSQEKSDKTNSFNSVKDSPNKTLESLKN